MNPGTNRTELSLYTGTLDPCEIKKSTKGSWGILYIVFLTLAPPLWAQPRYPPGGLNHLTTTNFMVGGVPRSLGFTELTTTRGGSGGRGLRASKEYGVTTENKEQGTQLTTT